MKGLGRLPTGPLRQNIRLQSSEYSVKKRVGNGSSYSGVEYDDKGTAFAYLNTPEKFTEIVISGEQQSGGLRGLELPVDDSSNYVPIERNDRLNFGASKYELEYKNPIPDENRLIAYELVFTEVIESG